jgi:hypothetical protein
MARMKVVNAEATCCTHGLNDIVYEYARTHSVGATGIQPGSNILDDILLFIGQSMSVFRREVTRGEAVLVFVSCLEGN